VYWSVGPRQPERGTPIATRDPLEGQRTPAAVGKVTQGLDPTLPRLGLLREISEATVLGWVIDHGPVTRAEIAAATGLSKPTVSQAVRRLEAAGLLQAIGPRAGRRGGVGILYDVPASAGVVVAVDLHQGEVRVRTCDLVGRTLGEHTRRPAPSGPPGTLGSTLLEAVRRAALDAPATVEAVGVAVANPVDPSSRRVLHLADTPFPEGTLQPAEVLDDVVRAPVLVDNDVNLAALAERRVGIAVGAPSFVYLYLGAGLGAAAYLGGDLVRGAHGLAGEVGYLPWPTARDETLARHLTRRDTGPPVFDVEAARAVLEGPNDAKRQALLAHLVETAAWAALAFCATLDPELVVVGGPLATAPGLLDALAATIGARWPAPPRIVRSALGPDGPLEGATQVALDAARAGALGRASVTAGPGAGAG
jgi:predicted NBD/HSP70 family sugar kinase